MATSPRPTPLESDPRALVAELLGTALLVFIGAGAATLMFGFKLFGASFAAGDVVTALAFGLVLLALAYSIGPLSGCHINPAVTMGFLATRRFTVKRAVEYWVAQVIGGIVGALILWGLMSSSSYYSRSKVGLGADGYGAQSPLHINVGGAIGTEIVLTFLFVFVVLAVTSRKGAAATSAMALGLALTTVHLVGIPLTGTSVNPARSIGPALVVEHAAISQLWVFIVAPLIGGVLAGGLHNFLFGKEQQAPLEGVARNPA